MAVDSGRHARTTAALIVSDYDLLVCSSASEVLLLTGYWPVMGASLAFFTRDGDVHLIVPEDECELAHKTSDAKVTSYTPSGLHTLDNPLKLIEEPVRSVLKRLDATNARFGIQLSDGVQPSTYAVAYQFRASLMALLHKIGPQASFASCDHMLEQMKAVKTTVELSLMQKGCAAAAFGFARARDCIRAGATESQVASSVQAAFESGPQAKGLERSYGYFYCMSGPNSAKAAAAYARTRERVIEEGDLVMIHANTCADGYWTDLTRTYTAGKPSEPHDAMREAIVEARAAGLKSIHPGAKGCDVDRACRTVMEFRGFREEFKHAAGHGVGFAAANPNGRPRIHPLSSDVLEPGMTFNLEPAAYIDGYGGMRHCDVVAVSADGVDVLSDF